MKLLEFANLIDGNPTHIATVRPDGKPNLAVAADVKVISNDEILISVNEMSNTQKNVDCNPSVVLTSFDKNWEGVRIFGKGVYYEDGKYFNLAKDIFDKAYFESSGKHIKGCLVIRADKVEEYK